MPHEHPRWALWTPDGPHILDLDVRLYLIRGGRASGKTYEIAYEADERANLYGWHIMFIRGTETSANDGVLADCRRAAIRSGRQHNAPPKSKEITYPSGGRISVRGTDLNPEARLRDITGVNLFVLEEAQLQNDPIIWETLEPTAREGGSKIWLNWNPRWPDDMPERLLANPPPRTIASPVLTFRDNPAPSRETLESERAARGSVLHPHIWLGRHRPLQGAVFHADRMVDLASWDASRSVRGWDIAGSEADTADRTVGVRLARCAGDGPGFCIEDAVIGRWEASERNRIMRETALADGPGVTQVVEITGSVNASVRTAELMFAEVFAGLPWKSVRPTGSKPERADPVASTVNAGNMGFRRGSAWIHEARLEMAAFPEGPHDDFVDALAHAFNELALSRPYTDEEFEVGIV